MTICFVCKTDQVVKYNLVLLYSYFYHLPQSKLGYFYLDNISENIKITIINNEVLFIDYPDILNIYVQYIQMNNSVKNQILDKPRHI